MATQPVVSTARTNVPSPEKFAPLESLDLEQEELNNDIFTTKLTIRSSKRSESRTPMIEETIKLSSQQV